MNRTRAKWKKTMLQKKKIRLVEPNSTIGANSYCKKTGKIMYEEESIIFTAYEENPAQFIGQHPFLCESCGLWHSGHTINPSLLRK
jgi:hypothetical protein